jgi:hypothetical protein
LFGFGGGGQGGSSTANISALLKLANSEFPFTGKTGRELVSVRCAAGTAIPYAKHAISIDENRMDFARVRWAIPDGRPSRDEFNNLTFEQVWFARYHADIGGGYQENESRLSDTAVKWMVACAYTNAEPISEGRGHLCIPADR